MAVARTSGVGFLLALVASGAAFAGLAHEGVLVAAPEVWSPVTVLLLVLKSGASFTVVFGALHFLMVAAAVGNRPAYLLAGAAAALIACWLWTDPVLLDMQIRHGIAVLGFAPAFFVGAALGGGYHYRSTAMEPGWAGLRRRSPDGPKAGPAA